MTAPASGREEPASEAIRLCLEAQRPVASQGRRLGRLQESKIRLAGVRGNSRERGTAGRTREEDLIEARLVRVVQLSQCPAIVARDGRRPLSVTAVTWALQPARGRHGQGGDVRRRNRVQLEHDRFSGVDIPGAGVRVGEVEDQLVSPGDEVGVDGHRRD